MLAGYFTTSSNYDSRGSPKLPMRAVLLVLVLTLAFAAGLCVGLLSSTHNTDNTSGLAVRKRARTST